MPKNDQDTDLTNPMRVRAPARALLVAGASLAAGATMAAIPPAAEALVTAGPDGGSASSAVPSPELLTPGAQGAAVKQLQRALHIQVNGVFGSKTRQAVITFQRRHHLRADGVVGPQTRRALHLHVRIVRSSGGSSNPSSSSTQSSSGYSIPASIVMCESGGNWSAVNSSTGAGGAYQIMPSTWAAYGGTGLPQDASPSEQSAIAAKIWASSGPGAWSC